MVEVKVFVGLMVLFSCIALIAAGGSAVLGSLQNSTATGDAGCNMTSGSNCNLNYNTTGKVLNTTSNVSSLLPSLGFILAFGLVVMILIGVFAWFRV